MLGGFVNNEFIDAFKRVSLNKQLIRKGKVRNPFVDMCHYGVFKHVTVTLHKLLLQVGMIDESKDYNLSDRDAVERGLWRWA